MVDMKIKDITDKPLTYKQRRFLKELIKTFSPTEAAMRTYHCKDRLSARNIASENLSKLGIKMDDLMEKTGLGIEEDIEDLKRLSKSKRPISADIFIRDENGELKVNKNSNDWVEVDDNHAQLKALELRLKLKGKLKENGKNNFSLTNISIKIEGADGDKIQTSQTQSVASFQR